MIIISTNRRRQSECAFTLKFGASLKRFNPELWACLHFWLWLRMKQAANIVWKSVKDAMRPMIKKECKKFMPFGSILCRKSYLCTFGTFCPKKKFMRSVRKVFARDILPTGKLRLFESLLWACLHFWLWLQIKRVAKQRSCSSEICGAPFNNHSSFFLFLRYFYHRLKFWLSKVLSRDIIYMVGSSNSMFTNSMPISL